MKFLSLFLFFFNLHKVYTNCDLEGVSEEQWQYSFDNIPFPDSNEDVFKEFSTTNVEAVTKEDNNDSKYFDIKLVDNQFSISPSKEFKNYENNESSKPNTTIPTIVLILSFTCTEGSKTLNFFQPITDTNNHQPYFQNTQYSSKWPMPLPPDFDLTCLLKEPIIACDFDISNVKLNFDINPATDLSITWKAATDDTNKCHTALLKTKGGLSLTERQTYDLTVTDTGIPSSQNFAKLEIEVDQEASIPESPQFSMAYFTATYNNEKQDHYVTFDSEITVDTANTDATFELHGDYKDNFDINYSNGAVVVTLKTNLETEVVENNVIILLTVEAKVQNAIYPSRSVLVIYMPKKVCPEVTTVEPPECTTAITTLPTSPPCTTVVPETTTVCPTCEPCSPASECPPCSSTAKTTIFDCPPCTTTHCPEHTTVIAECPTSCPPCTTQSTDCPTSATCSAPECPPCSTTPSSECPSTCTEPAHCTPCPNTPIGTNCPSVTTCATTVCPPCPTTPNPTDPVVTFEQDDYIFNIPSIELITVGVVRADATVNEKIEYSLEPFEGGTIPRQLQIDKNSGILSLQEKLEVGVYKVKVKALGLVSFQFDMANVMINVMGATHSLIVKEVKEKTETTIDLPCPDTLSNCAYKLVGQHPDTEETLFSIRDHELSIASIDLQMEELKNLLVPQFMLSLELTSSYKKNRNFSSHMVKEKVTEESYKWVLLPDKLANRPNTLIASIIINDINDKPPTFKEVKLTVGYPSQNIANLLTPPYVVKVVATDLDLLPLNSDIKYTTNSVNFIIHPKSGVIYLSENDFNEGEVFTVYATDQDGAGLQGKLEVEVIPLDESHLTTLKVKNKLIEDIDNVLEELSVNTNMNIKYLVASVITDDSSSTKRLTREIKRLFVNFVFGSPKKDDHWVSVVIYALDLGNKIILGTDVQSKLQETGVTEDVSVDNWTPSDKYNEQEEMNTTGFIAAIAVLGSLLVIFIVCVLAFYYFKIYKPRIEKPYNTMDNEDTASIQSKENNSSSDLSKRRPTAYEYNPPPIDSDDDKTSNNSGYEDVVNSSSKPNWGSGYVKPFVETVNYQKSFTEIKPKTELKDSLPIDNIPPPSYRVEESDDESKYSKKAVSFLPTVQKINIPVEVEKEEEYEHEITSRL